MRKFASNQEVMDYLYNPKMVWDFASPVKWYGYEIMPWRFSFSADRMKEWDGTTRLVGFPGPPLLHPRKTAVFELEFLTGKPNGEIPEEITLIKPDFKFFLFDAVVEDMPLAECNLVLCKGKLYIPDSWKGK